MNICDSNFFPDYEMRPPSDANPLEIVVTSIPTTATLVLWILFESRKSGVYFTRNMIALAKLVPLQVPSRMDFSYGEYSRFSSASPSLILLCHGWQSRLRFQA